MTAKFAAKVSEIKIGRDAITLPGGYRTYAYTREGVLAPQRDSMHVWIKGVMKEKIIKLKTSQDGDVWGDITIENNRVANVELSQSPPI